jgi:disulfide bond formation protein DsbB
MTTASLLDRPSAAPAAVLALSAATLGAALLSQYVGGLAPCVLCIWQRWPHAAAIGLAALAWLVADRRAGSSALLAAAGVALWIGAGVAAYHVGVEQGWWAGTPGCGVTRTAGSLEELRALVMNAPVVRCDEVQWAFLGLSMAGWNFLISLGLGGLALAAALRRATGRIA